MDHQTQLNKHCRVCAVLFKTKQYKSPCSKYRDGLLQAFGVDVNKDCTTVHPPIFCNTCYAKMQTYKTRPTASALKVQQWTPHTDGECGICDVFTNQSKGGCPKRERKNRGRPSADSYQQLICTIHQQAPPNWKVSLPLNLSRFLPLKVLGSLLVRCEQPSCTEVVGLQNLRSHVECGFNSQRVQYSPSKLTVGQLLARPLESPPTTIEQRAATCIVKRMMTVSPSEVGSHSEVANSWISKQLWGIMLIGNHFLLLSHSIALELCPYL